MKRTIATALLALALAQTNVVLAQSTAQILGSVRDASGGAVPGAQVKATQTETGLSRLTITGQDGLYVLPNLPIGPYSIEAVKDGFSKYIQTGIVLQVATDITVDVSLKVGAVTEQVQVEANAALVETNTTGVGQVIENQRILELPLNGRQATDLIQLAGAAVPQGSATSRSMQGGQAISVGGGQSFGVSYLLDGALHNNPFDNLNLPLPFPDALQEFKVETSALTAQNGMHSGAAVNAAMKAGTNEIHGDLFEFVRNGVFNARNFFAAKRDTLKRNQFGGTVGGPIQKNKLFFFAGFQGTRTRSDPSDQTTFVPTAAMLAGDFTTFASKQCNANALTLKAPFVNNQLAPALINKSALAIAAKLPTTADPCGKILFGAVTQANEYQVVGKVDYQLSANHSIFGRYMATTYYQPPPYQVIPNILNTIQGGRDNLAQSMTFGDTRLIGGTKVNSFRATVNRTAIHRTNADTFQASDVGINTFSYLPKYFLMTVTGAFAIGGGTENEATFRTTTYQIGDDFSWIKGAHQIAFGGTISQWRSNGYANVRSPGQFTVDGSVTGTGLGDFLSGQLGGANPFLQSAPNTLIAREWYNGYYVQDTWKVNRRLTLNYGLRWEPWFPQQLTNGAIYNFDYGRFLNGTKSTVFKNAPAGLYFPGDPGFPGQAGMNKKLLDFGPRVGLAFDPKGDGKMSIRASYGLAYDFVNGQFFINTANAPPFGSETRIPGVINLSNPFTNNSGIGNIFPIVFNQNAPFSLYGPFIALKYDQKTTAVHSWNFSLQRQLGSAWLVSATYLGNETQHLWVSTQLNPGIYIPGSTLALNQRRVFSLAGYPDAKYLGYVDQFDDGGTQSYNGLLLSLQKRLSNHYSWSANYTWSHCIGDVTQGGSTPNVGSGYVNPSNRRFDRGNCVSDRRHIFNLTAVAETPRFENKAARLIGTGWKLSGIYRAASGAPLLVTLSTDVQQSGSTAAPGGQRPNQILPDVYGTNPISQYLNSAAFQTPAAGTLGTLGRYSFFGPTFFQIDMALSRAFRIRERQTLEVRGEAFNLTNSLRSNNPVTTFGTPTFGRVLAAQDPRIMQFAFKYVF